MLQRRDLDQDYLLTIQSDISDFLGFGPMPSLEHSGTQQHPTVRVLRDRIGLPSWRMPCIDRQEDISPTVAQQETDHRCEAYLDVAVELYAPVDEAPAAPVFVLLPAAELAEEAEAEALPLAELLFKIEIGMLS